MGLGAGVKRMTSTAPPRSFQQQEQTLASTKFEDPTIKKGIPLNTAQLQEMQHISDGTRKKELVVELVDDGQTFSQRLATLYQKDNQDKPIEDSKPATESENLSITASSGAVKRPFEELKSPDSLSIPLNTAPSRSRLGLGLRSYQEDASDPDEDDYDRIAVDDIGEAMLRGMNWTPESGIGKTNRAVIAPVDIGQGQIGRLGLGAKPSFTDLKQELDLKSKKGIFTTSQSTTSQTVTIKEEDAITTLQTLSNSIQFELSSSKR